MFSKLAKLSVALMLLGITALSGCDDRPVTENTANNPPPAVLQVQNNNETTLVAPTIELQELPSAINLDPCKLLSQSELREIGLPDDQHIAQQGGTRQLPQNSSITPFVGCKWRSVDRGTPLAWVHIQQTNDQFQAPANEFPDLGDASWLGSYQGRDQLIVKTGSRLIMIVSQIPFNNKSEMDTNILIAKKVLSRLQQVTDSTRVKPANAKLVGGPAIDICAASRVAKPHQLLQGKVAWSFPIIEINHVPSQNKRPQQDGVSCAYFSDRRGSIYASYLGSDGVKRWNQHFEKNGEKVSFHGKDAYRDRKTLYIPLDNGAIKVDTFMIRYFTDEEIEQKINEIAKTLLDKL